MAEKDAYINELLEMLRSIDGGQVHKDVSRFMANITFYLNFDYYFENNSFVFFMFPGRCGKLQRQLSPSHLLKIIFINVVEIGRKLRKN